MLEREEKNQQCFVSFYIFPLKAINQRNIFHAPSRKEAAH